MALFPGCIAISESDRAELRTHLERHGERATVRVLGSSRTGLYRALAGLGLTAGLRSLIRDAMPRIRDGLR